MTAVKSFVQHIVQQQQGVTDFIFKKMVGQFEVVFVIQHIQILDYALVSDVSTGKTYYLVEDGQGVTHTAVGFQRNDVQSFRFGGNSLFRGYIGQVSYGIFHTDTVEVVYLTARKDGRQYLMFFGGGKNEYGMTGRLFQRFQESIESGSRQHMYLVNDIYLVFTYLRRDTYLLYQLADVVHGVVGCGIQFMNVVRTLFIESCTRFTLVTGFSLCRGSHAVYSFGKNTCASSLSNATRTAEKIGVRQFACGDGIL